MIKPTNPLAEWVSLYADRLWRRVNKSTSMTDCWEFRNQQKRYGKLTIRRRTIAAHRLAFYFGHGYDPAPLLVLHDCDNKRCCNPWHLWKGTNADNSNDMKMKGRAASGDRNAVRLYPEKVARGERQGSAKLTEDQVRTIRQEWKPYVVTMEQLAKRFGVKKRTVKHVLKRESWRHV